jgi:RecA-family ATPase
MSIDKKAVIDYVLSRPVVPEGQRHKLGILPCMIQLASNGFGLDESVEIVSRAYPIGSGSRKVTRDELEDAWKGAKAKDYKPWVETFVGTIKGKSSQYGAQPSTEPKFKSFVSTGRRESFEGLPVTPAEFINKLFGEMEWVCVGKKDSNGQLTSKNDKFCQAWAWGEGIKDDYFKDDQGVYFIVNPLKDWESRKDANVADYRRLLLELEVPKNKRDGMTEAEIKSANEMFVAALKDSGLPFDAIYTSGGPSVHGLVRVDAKSIEEFKEWQSFIYEHCKDMPGLDGQNGNPARYSRLPGSYHGEKLQQLISWQTGAESIQKWKESLPIDDGLPDIDSDEDLEAEQLERPKELVKGLIHKGSKAVIGSNSKGRKTMLLMDLGLSIASGEQWLGFETVKGKVLYINFELQKVFFKERRTCIARSKGLSDRAKFSENFDSWTLRGHAGDASQLVPAFIKRIQSRKYDAVIIDPTYKLMGANRDENATKDIASLLNEFEKLAVQTGAAVIFVSHFSKGNQAAKESIDRISGSGVFARDPDTIVTLTAHEEPDAMTVDCTLRNFPPVEQFTIKWNQNWLFERSGLDPKRVKKPAGRASKYNSDQLLKVLGDRSMTDTEWRLACQESEGIGKDAYYAMRNSLEFDKKVYKSSIDQKWSKTAREAEKG